MRPSTAREYRRPKLVFTLLGVRVVSAMYCAVRALLSSLVSTLFATVINDAALVATVSWLGAVEHPLSSNIQDVAHTVNFMNRPPTANLLRPSEAFRPDLTISNLHVIRDKTGVPSESLESESTG